MKADVTLRGSTTPDHAPADDVRARDDWLSRHPILGYAAITYAISWSFWGLAWLLDGTVFGVIAFFVGSFGPAAAAAIMLRHLGEPLGPWARSIIKWRVAPRFWLYAIALPVVVFLVANLSLVVMGQPVEWSLITERIWPYLGTAAFVMVIGGGQEEPGWRGYALPRLQARYSPVKATAILGVIWGVWHVPVYGPLGFAAPLVLAFFYTWLHNRTGSVLLAIVLHGGLTAAQDNLVLLADEIHGVTDLAMGIAYVVVAVTIVLATRFRLGSPPTRIDVEAGEPRDPNLPAEQ